MKTKKVIIFILISILAFNCENKCSVKNPDYIEIDPFEPIFSFSIIDKEGTDLFFCVNSIYDPNSIKVVAEQGISSWNDCFYIWIIEGKTNLLYVNFVPHKTDTIRIESHFAKWFEQPKGCIRFPIYKNDVFFNGEKICIDCDNNQIYKIVLK